MFGILGKKIKGASARKFLGTDNNSYIQWQVDLDGDVRLTLHDDRETIHFREWIANTDQKDALEFDKKMGLIVDEINAMRKSMKTKLVKK
jgi:hypothetical protein